MAKSKISTDFNFNKLEKEIRKTALKATAKNPIEITCPNCGKAMQAVAGKNVCPNCAKNVNLDFEL